LHQEKGEENKMVSNCMKCLCDKCSLYDKCPNFEMRTKAACPIRECEHFKVLQNTQQINSLYDPNKALLFYT
jgi:hypothetical protein